MSALTLPGDIPGLLRRGSPVLAVTGYTRDEPVGAPGVVVQVFGPDAEYPGIPGNMCVAFRWTSDATNTGDEQISECAPWDLALDLADPTGRAHAAWWLAERVLNDDGRRHAQGGVVWHGPGKWRPDDERGRSVRSWVLHGWTSMDAAQFVGREADAWSRERYVVTVVPALLDLDTMSPDVDAEALHRVVLHVAGRPA